MATKKWSEVMASAAYQQLPDQDKEAARNEYFNSVIAPQVPQNDLESARNEFFSSASAPSKPPGILEDTARSIPTAVIHGAAAIPGMVGDMQSRGLWDTVTWPLGKAASNWSAPADETEEQKQARLKRGEQLWFGDPVAEIVSDVSKEQGNRGIEPSVSQSALGGIANFDALPNSQEIVKGIENNVTGDLYKPQHLPGKTLVTAGDFASGALFPGNAARKIANVAAPAIGGEVVGAAAEGTPYEPYAKIGGSILGGMAGNRATTTSSAQDVAKRGIKGVSEQDMNAAVLLQQEANARGIPMSTAEAIAHTSGNKNLTDMQRIVENLPESSPIMSEFYRNRPEQIRQAAVNEFSNISPVVRSPNQINDEFRNAARTVVGDTEKQINAASRPFYDAAKPQIIPDDQYAAIASDPAFQSSLKRLRGNELSGSTVSNLPDNSIGVVDAVTKDMTAQGKALNVKGQGFNPLDAEMYKAGSKNARNVARNAVPDYDTALKIQAEGRQKYLEPLQKGLMGQFIKKNKDFKSAVRLLFDTNPFPGHADDVRESLQLVGKISPIAARDIVRAHVQQTFFKNAKIKDEWGGAKFSSAIAGNHEQREVLKAAIESLPNGNPDTWKGFETFLDILDASGTRQKPGSKTAYNEQIKDILKSDKSIISKAKETGKTFGLNLADRVTQAADRARIGDNAVELANIFTAQKGEGVKLLNQLAKRPEGSEASLYDAFRLLYFAGIINRDSDE